MDEAGDARLCFTGESKYIYLVSIILRGVGRMRRFRLFPEAALFATLALVLVLAVCVAVPPAQAQFVCVSTTSPTGAGATAAGSAQNVACGTAADALGAISSNSAFG